MLAHFVSALITNHLDLEGGVHIPSQVQREIVNIGLDFLDDIPVFFSYIQSDDDIENVQGLYERGTYCQCAPGNSSNE